jgi:anti-sigma-K factor RskA
VREYQEASTAIPAALDPVTPSPGLKDRVLAAATGRKVARPAILSRVFWSAAAVFLFALLFGSLFRERQYTHEVAIKATEAAPSAKGRIRWVDRYVKLEVQGLPAVPPGKAYQLWQIGPKGAVPVPAATFQLDSLGQLRGTDRMDYLIAKGQTFAVTLEPFRGSRAPTMPIFFTATVD